MNRINIVAAAVCLGAGISAHAQSPTPAATPAKAERSEYHKMKLETLPRDENGFLTPAVWDIVRKEAEANPKGNEARVLGERGIYQKYYATFSEWKAPDPLPVAEGKLRNLAEIPKQPRFEITGKVWPANPGDASICLWADDKLAAMCVGIDDNNAMDVPAWRQISAKYGGTRISWFLITNNIGGVVSRGRVVGAGTWELWQQLINEGFHLDSHSMTHNHAPIPEDGWPGPDWEAAESKRMLDTNLTGQRTKIFAYPGSGVHVFAIARRPDGQMAWRASVEKYYLGARTGGGQAINQANMVDYFAIRATTGAVPHLLGSDDPRFADTNLNTLFEEGHKNYRGWANIFIHFINLGKTFDTDPFTIAYGKALAFLQERRADLWNGYIDEVAMYGQERDTATVTTDESSAAKIAFTVTSKMDPTLFDYPLTIKVRLPASWKGIGATMNGAEVPAELISHEGGQYALVKVAPDRGQVILVAK